MGWLKFHFTSIGIKTILFLVSFLFTIYSNAQYPYRYQQYRKIPNASEYLDISQGYYFNENQDSALYYADLACENFIAQNNWNYYLFTCSFKAQILGENKQVTESIFCLENAEEQARRHIDTLNIEYIENIRLTAKTHLLDRNKKEATHYYDRAIKLLVHSDKYPEILALTYNELASIYRKSNVVEMERRYTVKAMSVLEECENDYAKAVLFYIQANSIDRIQNDLVVDLLKGVTHFCEKSLFTTDYIYFSSLLKLADNYSLVYKDYDKALYYLNLSIKTAARNKYVKVRYFNLYNKLGDIYRKKENYQQALFYFEAAQKIAISSYGSGSSHHMLSLLYMSRLYRNMERYELAETYLMEMKTFGTKNWGERFPRKSLCLGEFAQLYDDWQKYELALHFAQKMLFYSSRSDYKSDHELPKIYNQKKLYSYYNTVAHKLAIYSKLYHKTKDPAYIDIAIKHGHLADSLLNNLNYNSLSKLAGLENSSRFKTVAVTTADFCLTKFNLTKDSAQLLHAIDFYESASGNYLKYLITEKNNENNAHDPIIFNRQIELLELALISSQYKNAPLLSQTIQDSILTIKSNLVGNYLSQEKISINARDQKSEKTTWDIDHIQKNIPEGTVILDYQIQNDSILHIYAICKNSVQHTTEDYRIVQKQLQVLKRGIKTGNLFALEKTNRALSGMIISPFIDQKKHIVIIANDALAQVPVECLMADSSGVLCVNRNISYHYSIQLWFNSFNKSKPIENPTLLALSPAYDKVNIKYNTTQYRSETLDANPLPYANIKPLPYTLEEVEAIQNQCFNSNIESKILTHNQATKANFIAQYPNYDIVHIATHGIPSKKNYHNAGLLFTNSSLNNSQILFDNEIYTLKSNANLVVLSACETGVGEAKSGEGILALPRGFLYAGVPNIIASLWKVHDEKTKTLMLQFYKHLIEGKLSYGEALSKAKQDCIALGFLPIDWAGIILIGY